jgi:hypothetical protein
MSIILPHGITNSFKHGKIIYHCPLCSVTIDDAGYPDRSEAAKQHMIAHVMMEHGGHPEHPRTERPPARSA